MSSVPVRFLHAACGIPRILRKLFAQVVSTRVSGEKEESGPSLARCWHGAAPRRAGGFLAVMLGLQTQQCGSSFPEPAWGGRASPEQPAPYCFSVA